MALHVSPQGPSDFVNHFELPFHCLFRVHHYVLALEARHLQQYSKWYRVHLHSLDPHPTMFPLQHRHARRCSHGFTRPIRSLTCFVGYPYLLWQHHPPTLAVKCFYVSSWSFVCVFLERYQISWRQEKDAYMHWLTTSPSDQVCMCST